MIFKNRTEAGRLLAQKLNVDYYCNPIVFGLARGGVITAAAVAKTIHAPLDVLVVRKLCAPSNPEFGFGAIAPKGTEVIDWLTAEKLGLNPFDIEEISNNERIELERRINIYRAGKNYRTLKNRTAILVDDGIATGVSVRAAIAFLESLQPESVIVASPVCATASTSSIKREVEEIICLHSTDDFWAVGQFYEEFPQVTDKEVIQALKQFKS
jgi:predicted phosphoribosyltransferase